MWERILGVLHQPDKGCHVLIKAIRKLARADVRLKIYGNPKDSPAYFAELQSLADGAPFIEFCGTFPNGKIAEVLSGIDALVVPSVWFENAPLVIHSALAARCPVVASNFPGMSEVVRHGENGLLFEPGNPDSLADTLRRVLEEPTLLSELSSRCRPPKSIAEYVDEILAVYASPPAPEGGRGIVEFRRFEPMDPRNEASFVSGWCIAKAGEPMSVEIRVNDRVVAQTRQFAPRPDVRAGFGGAGLVIRGEQFGFALSFPAGIQRINASVRIAAPDGQTRDLSMSELAAGSMVKVGDDFFIGLDQECFS